jgi:hypothetical protein
VYQVTTERAMEISMQAAGAARTAVESQLSKVILTCPPPFWLERGETLTSGQGGLLCFEPHYGILAKSARSVASGRYPLRLSPLSPPANYCILKPSYRQCPRLLSLMRMRMLIFYRRSTLSHRLVDTIYKCCMLAASIVPYSIPNSQ